MVERGSLVTGLTKIGEGAARYRGDAPVQPCSVDLSVGNIYIPGTEAGKPGSKEHPVDGFNLDPGTTAIVETLEKCHLPDQIGAIGFPPNNVSSKGILMTNPGHVDPGYDGTMNFTVINMGQERYTLLRGNKIVTLLFFKLDRAPVKSLAKRPHGHDGIASQLGVLSSDFLDIEKRVKRASEKEEQKTRRLALLTPVVVGVIAVVATIAGSALVFQGDIRELRARNNALGDIQGLEQRVRMLESEQAEKRSTVGVEPDPVGQR